MVSHQELLNALTRVKNHQVIRFELPSHICPESLEVRGTRDNRTIAAKVVNIAELTDRSERSYNLP
jgi:hypothetical protein